MSWHIEQRDSQFCVVSDDNDALIAGAFDSRVEAIRQLRSMFAHQFAGGYASPSETMHTIPAADAPESCPPGHHKMPYGSCMPDEEMAGYQVEPAAMVAQTAPW